MILKGLTQAGSASGGIIQATFQSLQIDGFDQVRVKPGRLAALAILDLPVAGECDDPGV